MYVRCKGLKAGLPSVTTDFAQIQILTDGEIGGIYHQECSDRVINVCKRLSIAKLLGFVVLGII